jgi:hypothetical protein
MIPICALQAVARWSEGPRKRYAATFDLPSHQEIRRKIEHTWPRPPPPFGVIVGEVTTSAARLCVLLRDLPRTRTQLVRLVVNGTTRHGRTIRSSSTEKVGPKGPGLLALALAVPPGTTYISGSVSCFLDGRKLDHLPRFSFHVPSDTPPKLLVLSCVEVFGGEIGTIADALREAGRSPSVALHLGDQVYADGLCVHSPRDMLYEYLHDLYVHTWLRHDHMRELLSTRPNYFLPDDHDVVDNWPFARTLSVTSSNLSIAIRTTERYQGIPRLAPLSSEWSQWFHVGGRVGVVFIDVRSPFDWGKFCTMAMDDLYAKGCTSFYICVQVFFRPSPTDNVLDAMCGVIFDDAKRTFPWASEWEGLFESVCLKAEQSGCAVTILYGDAHNLGWGGYDTPNGNRVHVVCSSGAVKAPFPPQ